MLNSLTPKNYPEVEKGTEKSSGCFTAQEKDIEKKDRSADIITT